MLAPWQPCCLSLHLSGPVSHGAGLRGQLQTNLKPTGPQTGLTGSTQPWRFLKPGHFTYISRFLAFLRKAGSSGRVHSNSSQGSPQNPSSSWLPLDSQSAVAMKQAFPLPLWPPPSSFYLTPQHDLMPNRLLLGEGNGTPLQYSCLENPMDWGAW